MMEEKAMFRIKKQKALYQEKATYEQNLIEELEKLYELNANFGASRDSAYLKGNTELEIAINKILELKNTQVREQFLLNSELIEYVTNMTYIKDMVDHISIQKKSINNITSTSEDMCTSSEEIADYVQDSFLKTKGAVDSIGDIEESLGEMNSIFDHISANVEEQCAATQEVSARLNEINDHTSLLNDIILRTGQGIYSISTMAENLRVSALPYFKDFKGNDMFIPITAEHLLWKWKAYNAVCGFVKIDENSIQGHDQCTFGKFSANNNIPDDMKKLIEPHEQIHTLAKEIVRAVNMGERDYLNDYLKKLDLATDQFTEGLKNIKF